MKTTRYQRRFYRDWITAQDLHLSRFALQETDLAILTDKPVERDFIQERISLYRRQIQGYIARDPRFLTSLKPLVVELNAPMIVRVMSRAGRMANVGPMASVAGAIAERLGRDLIRKGHRDTIIENGGDIFMLSSKMRSVGIYAGSRNRWSRLRLKIKPADTPLGICASSGVIGHSLSFGRADSVVILSPNTALADAVATACANRVHSKADLNPTISFARSIKGISGGIIILGGHLATWGKLEFLS